MEYTIDNPLRCFFAFEGYNSQGLALNRLKQYYPDFGWVCVGRSEIDKYSIQAANVLFPEYKDRNYGDISKINWDNVPDFDLFTYSFPCTNLSFAGKQEGFDEGSGTASSLLWECRKAIVAKKPKYLLMENVKALVSAKFKPLFMKWQNELASYGYVNFVKVLDSQHLGVPQHRERVFMVSILDEDASFHFPEPFPLEKKLKDVLESNVDEKYYLSEKIIKGFLAHAERHKNDGFKFNPTDGDVVANSILASSQCRPCDNYIKEIGNLYNDNKQAGRVYDAEGISHTLTAQDAKNTSVVWERANNISYKITKDGKIRAYQNDDKKSGVSEFQIDNEESVASTVTTAHAPKCYGESMGFRIRKLTPRECFRLQDVDDADIDKLLNSGISNSQLYKMAGNSITIAPLYHIFRKLFIEKDNENQQLALF